MSFTLVKNELILTITKDKLVCILSIQKVKFDAKVQLFSDIRKFLSIKNQNLLFFIRGSQGFLIIGESGGTCCQSI